MKKLLLITIGLFFSMVLLQAQNDNMYIIKSGNIVGQYETADVDSIIFYDSGLKQAIPFTDARDGNLYQTTLIGNQVWMAENLRYLPSVVSSTTVSNSTPYHYVYDYFGTTVADAKATKNYNTYGVLYNWSAAMAGAASSETNPSGIQGVCPVGWHLPSNAECIELKNYLIANGYNYNGSTVDNKIAKSMTSIINWDADITFAGIVGNADYPEYRNKSGFTAIPSGYCSSSGFQNMGFGYYFWCSTESTINTKAWYWVIYTDQTDFDYFGKNKDYGHSVRCVKN
ncbi:MAG: FISUMP domain-containing protein [Bacteroidales bacterium]|nr:FISUMP domain-containing protein [Bacteroidales bacterium]